MILNNVLFNEGLSRLLAECLVNRLLVHVCLGQETVVARNVASSLGSSDAKMVYSIENITLVREELFYRHLQTGVSSMDCHHNYQRLSCSQSKRSLSLIGKLVLEGSTQVFET